MIDSHAHLDTFDEAGDVEAMLNRARDAGVRAVVAIGGSPEANRRTVRLAAAYPGRVFGTAGYDRDLAPRPPPVEDAAACLDQPGMVAVGETGLDYHYEPETATDQKRLFAAMLELAAERTKPVVVHSRDADDDTFAMLREYTRNWKGDPGGPGVLHCFTGNRAFARKLLDLGMMISFSGIVTFRNADSLREAAQLVPSDRTLIETDAPYLAPVPHRGKSNEPAYVVHVAETLATVRGVDVETIKRETALNTATLFQLDGQTA